MCNVETHLCEPEWLGDIGGMIDSGDNAVDISKEVEEILKNETMSGGSVNGGTISSLVDVMAKLIDLRRDQTNDSNSEQTVEFAESFLQSVDIVVAACEGWQNIFDKAVRYQTMSSYLRYIITIV